MANFLDCSNWLHEALIKSLINEDASGYYGLRTVQVSKDDAATTISCGTATDFWDLFSQAIGVGDDGKPVLRLVITNYANGVGLSDSPDCGTNESLFQMMKLCFCTDTNGEIALQLWNIT